MGKINYEDEFGDPTGEVGLRIFCNGVFSNSATSNSKLIVRITDDNESIFMSLFEYGTTPGTALKYKGTFGKFICKLEDGSKVSINAFAAKSGGILISKDNYTSFKKLLTTNNKIQCYISKYSFDENGSSYLWTINAIQN